MTNNVHIRSRRAVLDVSLDYPSDDEDGEWESSGDVPTDEEVPVVTREPSGDFGKSFSYFDLCAWYSCWQLKPSRIFLHY